VEEPLGPAVLQQLQAASAWGRSPAARGGGGSALPGGRTGWSGRPPAAGPGLGNAAPFPSPSLFPAGVTPGSLRRPRSRCPCKGRGPGSQIPELDFDERAGGDALAHMLRDARGARGGQGGIFPGCEQQRCTTARLWQGRGRTALRSSRAPAPLAMEPGGTRVWLLPPSRRDSVPLCKGLLVPGARSPATAAPLPAPPCRGLRTPLPQRPQPWEPRRAVGQGRDGRTVAPQAGAKAGSQAKLGAKLHQPVCHGPCCRPAPTSSPGVTRAPAAPAGRGGSGQAGTRGETGSVRAAAPRGESKEPTGWAGGRGSCGGDKGALCCRSEWQPHI